MYMTANRKFPKKWIVSSVLHLQCYVVTNDSSYESYGMTHRLPHLSLMPLERTPMLLEAKIRNINLKIKKKTYFFVYFVVVKRCMTVSYNDTFQNCILIIQLKLELLT